MANHPLTSPNDSNIHPPQHHHPQTQPHPHHPTDDNNNINDITPTDINRYISMSKLEMPGVPGLPMLEANSSPQASDSDAAFDGEGEGDVDGYSDASEKSSDDNDDQRMSPTLQATTVPNITQHPHMMYSLSPNQYANNYQFNYNINGNNNNNSNDEETDDVEEGEEEVLPIDYPYVHSEDNRSGAYTWRIPHFPTIRNHILNGHRDPKLTSPAFERCGIKWRLLFFPLGNHKIGAPELSSGGFAAIYVEAFDLSDDYKPVPIQFAMSLVPSPYHTDAPYVSSNATHNFHNEDRGFSRWSRVRDYKYFIQHKRDDSLIIQCLIETPTADQSAYKREMHKMEGYNPKIATGYVGLKNQGATCYMNSLLQALYHIPQFRSAVYNMPLPATLVNSMNNADENDENATVSKKDSKSISLALQRVFYQLQTSAGSAVSTQRLTASFGWDSMDSFMQHDVQEFSRVLLDSLESTLKQSNIDTIHSNADAAAQSQSVPRSTSPIHPIDQNVFNKLFEGISESFVKCLNVPFASQRREPYLDISLNVKGCKNLFQSLDEYVAEEKLTGDNQYRAEGFGKQDAVKGTKFLSFPNVLQLQLKRFEYDPMKDSMSKINDRFEFETRMDLSKYGPKDEIDVDDPPIYYLHSILVHSGSFGGGHYYSYIRPLTKLPPDESPWIRFDDDTVYQVDEEDAVQNSFGGEYERREMIGMKRKQTLTRTDNAYMLIYLRQSATRWKPDLSSAATSHHTDAPGPPLAESKTNSNHTQQATGSSGATNGTEIRALSDETQGDRQVDVVGGDGNSDATTEVSERDESEHISSKLIEVPIPLHLRELFEHETKQSRALREQLLRAQQYINIELVLEPQLLGVPVGSELDVEVLDTSWMVPYYQSNYVPMEAKKSERLSTYAERIAELSGIPAQHQQYWKFVSRDNRTLRTNNPIPPDTIIEEIAESKRGTQLLYRVYVRDIRRHEVNGPFPFTLQHPIAITRQPPPVTVPVQQQFHLPNQQQPQLQSPLQAAHIVEYDFSSAFLILKYFDVAAQSLSLVSSVIMRTDATVRDLKAQMRYILRQRGLLPPAKKFTVPPPFAHPDNVTINHTNDLHANVDANNSANTSNHENSIPSSNGVLQHQHQQAPQQERDIGGGDKSPQKKLYALNEEEIYSLALKYYTSLRDAGQLSHDALQNLTDDEWRYPLVAYDEENVHISDVRPRVTELHDDHLLYDAKNQGRSARLQHGDIVSMYIPHSPSVLQEYQKQHEEAYRRWRQHRYNALYLQSEKAAGSGVPSSVAPTISAESANPNINVNATNHTHVNAAIISTTINNQTIESKSDNAQLHPSNQESVVLVTATADDREKAGNAEEESGATAGGELVNVNRYQMRAVRQKFYDNLYAYYFYLRCRQVVEFRAMPWKAHPTSPHKVHPDNTILYIELDRRWNMEFVSSILAQHILEYQYGVSVTARDKEQDKKRMIDPLRLRYYSHQSYGGQSGPADGFFNKHPSQQKLFNLIQSYDPSILYYEVSEYSWNDFIHNYLFDIQYVDKDHNTTDIRVLVPKDGTVSDIQAAVAKKMLPKPKEVNHDHDDGGGEEGDDVHESANSSDASDSSDEVHVNMMQKSGEEKKMTLTHPPPAVAVAAVGEGEGGIVMKNSNANDSIPDTKGMSLNGTGTGTSDTSNVTSKRKAVEERQNNQQNDPDQDVTNRVDVKGTEGDSESEKAPAKGHGVEAVKRRRLETPGSHHEPTPPATSAMNMPSDSHTVTTAEHSAAAATARRDGHRPTAGSAAEGHDNADDDGDSEGEEEDEDGDGADDSGCSSPLPSSPYPSRNYSDRFFLTTLCLWDVQSPHCGIQASDVPLQRISDFVAKYRNLVIRVDHLSDQMAIGNLSSAYTRVWCMFYKEMPKSVFNYRWKMLDQPFLSYTRVLEPVETLKNRIADQFHYSMERRKELRVALLTSKVENYRGTASYGIRTLDMIDVLSSDDEEEEDVHERQAEEEELEGESSNEGEGEVDNGNELDGNEESKHEKNGDMKEEVVKRADGQDGDTVQRRNGVVNHHSTASAGSDAEMASGEQRHPHHKGEGEGAISNYIAAAAAAASNSVNATNAKGMMPSRPAKAAAKRKPVRVPRVYEEDITTNQEKTFFGIMDPHMKDKAAQARSTRNSKQQPIKITLQTDQP